MNEGYFNHPFTKLVTIVVIMMAGFFVMFVVGFFLALLIFNLSPVELYNFFNAGDFHGRLNLLKYFQIIQTIGLFVLPPIVIARLFSKNTWEFLGFSRSPRFVSVATAIVLIFVALPFIDFLSHINQSIPFPDSLKSIEEWLINREESARDITYSMLNASNISQLLVNIVMVGVLPAIGEELVFRGILQRLFADWTRNVHWGIIISAILFSAMHIQFFGFIPRLALGILFGYLLFWSGSIWLPILSHFVNNTSAVIYYYYVDNHTNISPTSYGSLDIPEITVIFSVILTGLCCFVIYLYEKPLRMK